MKFNKKLLEDLFMEEILKSILSSMKLEAESNNALEAHEEADALLVEVVKELAKGHPREMLILEIISQYNLIPKRYA
jgi:c-di-GMP-related signal transduction protein